MNKLVKNTHKIQQRIKKFQETEYRKNQQKGTQMIDSSFIKNSFNKFKASRNNNANSINTSNNMEYVQSINDNNSFFKFQEQDAILTSSNPILYDSIDGTINNARSEFPTLRNSLNGSTKNVN